MTPRAHSSSRWGWLVGLWPLFLACVLVAPLLIGDGYPLARDLIFVPHPPLNDAALGLGDGPPRAVPLDAVVSSLSWLVDGAVLARIVLPLTLAVAGWGVGRMVAPLGRLAQCGAMTFAVWNAYVVERLALGQWALLLAYAALPWLVMAAGRFRREGRAVDAGVAIAWAAVASLTPSGGLLALCGLLAGGLARSRRSVLLVIGGVLLQVPWVVAALATPAARLSDPAGVGAFAPDTEARWGSAVALLGLGGIWDSGAEPATRTSWLALVAAAGVVAGLVLGWAGLRRVWGRGDLARWAALAGLLAVGALVTTTPPGRAALEWAVVSVPGVGLLRDSQKFMAPAALLAAAAFGAAVGRCVSLSARMGPEVRLALLLPVLISPVLLLPDATTVTWPTVQPVHYPAGFDAVDRELTRAEAGGVLVTLPWRSYRAFDWATHGLTSSDPALRWFDIDVVTSDDLQVGDTLVTGESALAAQIGQTLRDGPPAQELGALGVSWVLVYPDDPAAGQVDRTGLIPAYADEDVELFAVPNVGAVAEVGSLRRALVVAAHLLWLAVLLVALGVAATRRRPPRTSIAAKCGDASY